MSLTTTRACVLAALMMAAAAPAWAQAQPTPGQGQPGAPRTEPPPAGQPQPAEPEPTPSGRRGRRGRTSNREPSTGDRGAAETRPSREAGPSRQELTFDANLLGGYDDNLIGGLGAGAGGVPTAMASGSTGSLDGTLTYFRGNQLQSFRLNTTGNVLAYPDYFDRPVAGGTATIEARTGLGRPNTLTLSQRAGYEPVLNVFSPGGNGAFQPPDIEVAAPTTGLFERRSVNSRTGATLESRWGGRDTVTVGYAYTLQDFLDDDFGDNTSHTVTTTYAHALGAGARARADYGYMDLETFDAAGASLPNTTHRVEGGMDLERALNRSGRRLELTLLAGAARLESIIQTTGLPFSAWMPAGSATARLAFSPQWFMEGRYRRDFALLQGVTDDVYTSDTASITTGGFLAARTDVQVGATYGNWQTPVASGVTTSFDVYGGVLQVRQLITETVALTAAYNYYHHRYSDAALLPVGFPAEYDRHAVRVGISVRVPLVGAPSSRSPLRR